MKGPQGSSVLNVDIKDTFYTISKQRMVYCQIMYFHGFIFLFFLLGEKLEG